LLIKILWAPTKGAHFFWQENFNLSPKKALIFVLLGKKYYRPAKMDRLDQTVKNSE